MRKLSTRLILSASLWISFILIVGGAALSYNFQRSINDAFLHRLETFLNALIAASHVTDTGKLEVSRDLGDPRFKQILSGWYWQISNQDTPLVRSRSLWDQVLTINRVTPDSQSMETYRLPDVRGRDLLILDRALQINQFDGLVYFTIAADVSELTEEQRTFNTILVISLLCLGIGVLIALFVQVQFGLKPLKTLTQDVESVRQRKIKELQENYPDEILPLVNATNAVLRENQEQLKRARHHAGNLAHALKTPLSILKVDVQNKTKPLNRESIFEQIENMARIVDYRLTRAAAAGTSAYTSERIPVLETITPICRLLQKGHAEGKPHITFDIPESLVFLGERQDLEEILGNLLENAFKWAHCNIHVSVHLEAETTSLQISDDGPGMNPEVMNKARIRGQRLDEQTPGYGLGLSIVSDLVDTYQGHMAMEQSSSGGLLVTVTFPIGRFQAN